MNSHQAKKIPLTEILDQLGYQPHHEVRGEVWHLSPFRSESEPSFAVNTERNIWHDFGEGKGGNVLDFVMEHYGISDFSSALRQLEQLMGQEQAEPITPTIPATKTESSLLEVQKIQPLQNQALTKYLRERSISTATARPYVKEIYYRRSRKDYFALAFPNESMGYELRNAYFKGVHGTKDLTVTGRKDLLAKRKASVTVFEGFMDFLSALEHYQKPITTPVIVLNSVAMKDRAVQAIRDMGADKVYLYLDHDKAGRELTEHFKQQLHGATIVDNSDLYAGYKDFNEWLVKVRKRAKNQ